MLPFSLNGNRLSLTVVEEVAFHRRKIKTDPSVQKRMLKSYHLLREWMKSEKIIYGLNTGFGILSDVKISPEQGQILQTNLIRSHACGVGNPLSEEEVRAIIFLRAQTLIQGHSGVRPLIVEKLLYLLNKSIVPFIPQKGSVGASGDLAPLAHLALVLIGEGKIIKGHAIRPIQLQGREGLALINGTQVMTALSALNVLKAKRLLKLANVAAALTIEAIQGSKQAFHPALHKLRPHPGQVQVAKTIWKLLQNSKIQDDHKHCSKVQDPYSIRCVPQVHGSSQDALVFAENIVEIELNSVTDNPIIFPKPKGIRGQILNGGNFHGQYLSQAMDFVSIAMTTLTNISERRIEKILNPHFSGLSSFLAHKQGLESGLMLTHVTASALASQNKVLSHPASTDTIPTSGNKEDHVSMGVHAALKTKEILANVEYILATEFLAASQGIEYRRPLRTNPLLEKVMTIIRSKVPPIKKDRIFSKDMTAIKNLFPDILSELRDIL